MGRKRARIWSMSTEEIREDLANHSVQYLRKKYHCASAAIAAARNRAGITRKNGKIYDEELSCFTRLFCEKMGRFERACQEQEIKKARAEGRIWERGMPLESIRPELRRFIGSVIRN
jgi:hypothetical protein